MKNFSIKRFTASLLFIVMVVAALPVSLFNFTISTSAAGETIYVLAGSDFQPTDASNTTGVNLLNGILNQIKTKYTTMNGFLFAGDYDYNYTASQSGKEALQAAVQSVYGTGMDEIYVQGNHDVDSLVGSVLSPSGNNDTDNYGVFVINEKDYMWYNDDEATIKNTAASLETYLNAKRNAGYTKPIFVMSHLPLHYCMRTQVGGGDGKHANYIFDVLNEAGAAGLNIIFLFGHNHSHGWDDPYGGAAIFLKEGDSINIAQNSTTNYNVETLNFTYMNAGYVSYYRNVNSGAETDLSMTVFAITDTDVTIERYTADGLHDLKSAGVANTHASTGSSVDGSCSTNHGGNETYSPDTSVVASAYTLTLNTEITPAGTEVEAPSSGTTTTQRTYTRVTSLDQLVSGGQYLIIENSDTDYFMLPESISNSAGDRIGYNIESTTVAGGDTITGDYSAKEWTMTGSGTSWVLSTSAGSAYMEYQSSSRAYGRISSTNSSTFTIGGSADAYTFSTTTSGYTYVFDHSSAGLINGYVKTPSTTFYIYRLTNEGSSTPTVETSGGSWVKLQDATSGTSDRYDYTLDTDGVNTDSPYLIVGSGDAKAMGNGSLTAVDTTISGSTASMASQDYEWKINSNNQIYRTVGNTTYYLKFTGPYQNYQASGSVSVVTSASEATSWDISHSGKGAYSISYTYSYGSLVTRETTYYLRYNSNAFSVTSFSNTVRLYGNPSFVEGTAGQSALYGGISGELTYNVAIGTSAEDAVAAVKDGITVYYSTTNTGEITSGTVYPDDGEGMTWTLDSSYDGVTPGEYAVTIAYNGVTLGVAKVVVPSVAIDSYSIDPLSATVRQGAAQSIQTGSTITVTLENGDYYTVPVTISMLSKNGEAISTAEAGTQTGLTVTYNGVVITNNYTLTVTERVYDDYPDYPDEGAVKVNKTAIYTEEKFRETGVAQVELSVSGIPAQRGVDVVVVIDTSSSMDKNIEGKDPASGEMSRIEILSEALEAMLITFQTPDDAGNYPDIDIAVIDFNGYSDRINGASLNNTYRDNEDLAEVYTGVTVGAGITNYISITGLSAANFVDVTTLDAVEFAALFNEDRTSSGTNYDSGLDNAHKLLEMKQAENGDEERDQYVIFLSDGAPFRYNGYENGSSSGYNNWDKWLRGYWADQAALEAEISSTDEINAYPYFYNGNGSNHPHRIAEAIKGALGTPFDVVVNTATDADPAYIQQYYGLGAKIYSIGFGLAEDGDGVDSAKGSVVVSTMQNVLQTISSGDGFYYDVDSADELTSAFTQIATAINYAASNARFVDQMGTAFDLQMASHVERMVDNNPVTLDFTPTIEVKSYDIYTLQDYLDGTITKDKIGVRKGTYTVLETVIFNNEGTAAYSNKIDVDKDGIYGFTVNEDGTYTIDADDNILGSDGLIYAQTFYYNTTDQEKTATNTTITVEPETFYWKVGTVTTSELAISYYVYLTDTMEGEREAGSYATNNFAVLYYDNYLGNECKIETVSPMLAWKEANVSYAFYLVDTDGNVIVNRATGQTGTFANKIAITNPVIFATCKLNTENEVPALSVSKTDLPSEYEIYDPSALYKVVILSYQDENAATVDAGWTITTGKTAHTTYVTGYSTTEPYSNALTQNGNYDYTHTTVWFAVVWEPGTIADQVVIDYGLPVDISVLENDLFASGATLNGIGTTANKPTMADGHNYAGEASTNFYTTEQTFQFGKAIVNGDKVRYTPTSTAMTTYDKFAYEVKFDYNGTNQFYYGDVTVIPATIIYYEETFVDFENGYTVTVQADGTTNKDTAPQVADSKQVSDGTEAYGDWVKVGTEIIDATQAEDRPGQYSLSYIDANNLYGYDGVNSSITKYSLGTAMQVTVGKTYDSGTSGAYTTTGYNGYTPTATFTFTGTGFDIISLTDSDSGMIKVTITGGPNNTTESMMITNYYGMSYQVVSQDENGNDVYGWVSDENGALYQVPVIKKTGLDYGTYTVTIQVGYMTFFDQDNGGSGDGKYYFVLDAIRIYDPSNGGSANDNDTVIEDAYKADGEAYPHYLMVKEAILGKTDLENLSPDNITGTLNGTVFIDGKGATTDAADYANPGPNNEAYLINAQSISFKLTANAVPTDVQLGAKLASGTSATVNVYYGSTTSDPVVINLDSATDMYYSIMENLPHTMTDGSWTTNTIIIEVVADDSTIVSLTNIKATFKSDKVLDENGATTDEDVTLNPVSATASTGTYSLMSARMMNLETTETVTEEPVSISFLVDAEVIEDACAVMTELYAPEPEVFVPEVLEYTVSNGFFGYSTVVILTSKDVESITVNGVEATKISGSRMFNSMLRLFSGLAKELGITSKTTDYYIWTVSTKRAASYDIVAVNADGLASDPTLTDSNTSITKEDVESFFDRERIFEIMEEIANQTFDPEQFEAYVNERFDGMREIITQTSEDVEYVIINGKIVDRYITETVIDTETGETTTKRVWITDADDEAEDEEVEVNVYDRKGVGSESKKAERRFKNNKNNSNNGNSNSASDKNNKENNGKGNSGKYGRM